MSSAPENVWACWSANGLEILTADIDRAGEYGSRSGSTRTPHYRPADCIEREADEMADELICLRAENEDLRFDNDLLLAATAGIKNPAAVREVIEKAWSVRESMGEYHDKGPDAMALLNLSEALFNLDADMASSTEKDQEDGA